MVIDCSECKQAKKILGFPNLKAVTHHVLERESIDSVQMTNFLASLRPGNGWKKICKPNHIKVPSMAFRFVYRY